MPANFEIKRVDLWSLFKIAFFIYVVIGLIVGFLMFFFSLIMGGFTTAMYENDFPGIGLLGGALGFFLIPFLAFFYGVIGSVFVTICGGVFNLICGLSGGIRLEVNAPGMGHPGVQGPVSTQIPPSNPAVGTQETSGTT